jgi:L-cysteate sulfo-lyase
MHKAIEGEYDCIVTWGSNQSNWCRMTSAAGAYIGLEVFMIFDGEEPKKATGNLILDLLVGARIEYLNDSDPSACENRAISLVKELISEGRRPMYIPVGGSIPLGTLGYLNAFREIMNYSEKTGNTFKTIYVATGSAGTQAGLVLGQVISGWEGEIIGISVGREKAEQEEMIYSLLVDTANMLEIDQAPDAKLVKVDDAYYGNAYRENTAEAGKAIRFFAENEGIFLDEVYTGKAASGMLDHIPNTDIADYENILFIHTGGGIQLFE